MLGRALRSSATVFGYNNVPMFRTIGAQPNSSERSVVRPRHPARTLVFSFLVLVVLGALLLRMPFSVYGEPVSWSTAFFTSTSAVCVTGLAVTDTATTFSPIGQLIILLMIQIGGLGYMVASSLLFLLFGREPTLHERLLLRESFGHVTLKDTGRLLWRALRFALGVEAVGAVILTARFYQEAEHDLADAAWRGVFHAVSAFCNAGFDILGRDVRSGSLIGYRDDVVVNFTVAALIIIGGLGFAVCQELLYERGRSRRMTLHSRMVLAMTFCLVVLGTVSFLLTEWSNANTLAPLPLGNKMLVSFFQSVSFRTAGFATVDFADLRSITLLLGGMLMFIGASPGGTGGGIKTTTFAAVLVAMTASLRGRRDAEIFHRRLDNDLVFRAMLLIFMAVGIIVTAMFALTFTEPEGLIQAGYKGTIFVDLQFEVISASGTVGLSTGITPQLSEAGRMVIMALMFLGRLGPTTVAVAFAASQARRKYRLPDEKVALG
jgi:trk system potassium uptake protein TrkH